jgi:hypothetical protein
MCFFEANGQSLPIPASIEGGITKVVANPAARIQILVVVFFFTVPPQKVIQTRLTISAKLLPSPMST